MTHTTRTRAARRQLSFGLILVVACLLASQLARAQALTGTLSGTVKDEQGGVLAGAVVRVTSSAIIGGERHTTTSDKGQWRVPVLAPGAYVLTVELAPRFTTYRTDAISLSAGATIDQPVVLKLAGVVDSVTVNAASSLDAKQSGLATVFGPDYVETIPTRRYSMFDLIKSAPGVSPTSPASGTVNTVSVFGSAVNENLFMIDGTNFTCPCQGVSRAEPSVDVIQELQVQSTGASVEFGNIQGGVFNVVTKQGGARYEYDASYYGQPSGLTAQSKVFPAPNGASTGYERVRYRDFTTNLGGPIRRDRLWFFTGYQYLRDYDSQPGANPASPRRYEQNKFFGKLTWRLTPSLQLMQSFHKEAWVDPTVPTRTVPYETTQRVHASVPSMTFAHLTHVLSNNTVWEARVGRFIVDQESDPTSGDRETPGRRDAITSVQSVNSAQMGATRFDRITAKALLNRYQQDWAGADHHFKIGTQLERGEHRSTRALPGGVQYIDNNGRNSQSVSRDPLIAGGRFITAAAFASDTLTLSDRLTADAGLRFDHLRAISQDLGGVDALGRPADGVTPGVGTLYTWNVVSPRLGLILKLAGDGRTVLRANYGRFNQGVLTGELEPIHPGVTTITTMEYEEATDRYTKPVSVVDPKRNIELDRAPRTPHTDEYSVAVDHQITPWLASSAAYIRKRGRDFIGWMDTGGVYSEGEVNLPNGTVLPVQNLTNGTGSRVFFLTNPEGLFLDYDGFVVALQKRLSHRWQASGSYTYSRTHGRLVTSNAPASEAQFSTIARPTSLTFGQDPNDLTNSTGRLPNDRPHVFRTTGVVHLPWQGILVAANLQHFSGRPWAATAQVRLNQSPNQRILIEPRGSRRLSSQSLLDLRVAKTFSLGSAATVDLRLDLLNLLNDSAEEAVTSDVLFNSAGVQNPTFGQPNVFMDPRRAMLSVRLNLGR